MTTPTPKRTAEPTPDHHRAQRRRTDGSGDDAAPAAVEVSRLRKTYPGGIEAVKGIDFTVAPGEVFGLLGPNGAGKSTTIGMLTTTVRPTSGSARLAGYDVATQPLRARSVSSVVFQDAVVDGALSGRAQLELHARLWGVPAPRARRRIAELVDAVGLSELILDEAQRLADRVAIIHHGQIVALDRPHALLEGLGREILEFRADGNAQAALTTLRHRGVARDDAFAVGARVTVPLHEHPATEALAAIDTERLRVSEIATRLPTFDDVYLHLTGAPIDTTA